tara:strand:- start:856 stop:1011 length:156 start_codon:yes stop_codon:yes gene_type:complete
MTLDFDQKYELPLVVIPSSNFTYEKSFGIFQQRILTEKYHYLQRHFKVKEQ